MYRRTPDELNMDISNFVVLALCAAVAACGISVALARSVGKNDPPPASASVQPVIPFYCKHCGFTGMPKTYSPGSLGLEVVLFLFFILPWIIYRAVRLSKQYEGCPQCGTPHMIPADSPASPVAGHTVRQ
jgi:hypothetical protein